MIDQHCQRCGGGGWVTTVGALCTDGKRRTVRCKCPACNYGNPEIEQACAKAVQDFIDAHHNPIVRQHLDEAERLRAVLRRIVSTHGYSDDTFDAIRHEAAVALGEKP